RAERGSDGGPALPPSDPSNPSKTGWPIRGGRRSPAPINTGELHLSERRSHLWSLCGREYLGCPDAIEAQASGTIVQAERLGVRRLELEDHPLAVRREIAANPLRSVLLEASVGAQRVRGVLLIAERRFKGLLAYHSGHVLLAGRCWDKAN